MENRNRYRSNEKDAVIKGLMVTVNSPDRLESALKKLKRMVKDSKILVYVKENEHFRKPSAIKREKKLRGIARQQMIVREEKERNL